MGTKLFISHSSADKELGELFLNFLLALGFNKKDIFYSSKYHNGVELGKNFSDVVKDNFQESDIVVYLLTENFYKSDYCHNEIGAGWISDDKIKIPILIGLQFSDMRGFIGSQTKAFSVTSSEEDELYSYFANKIKTDHNNTLAKQKYYEFLHYSNPQKMSASPIVNDKEAEILNGLKKSNNGMIPYFSALNVVSITIDGKNICDGLDLTERLEYKDAVEHLFELGYAKKSGMFISLTGKGAKLEI